MKLYYFNNNFFNYKYKFNKEFYYLKIFHISINLLEIFFSLSYLIL